MSEDSTQNSKSPIYGLLAMTALIGGSIGIAIVAVYSLHWVVGF
jgi:hypothetical protein